MVKSRHFNLNSLNSVATHEPDLGVLLSLLAGLSELESNQPFDLRLYIRVRRINVNVRDVKASKAIA
jgi:hypothetical protein